MPPVSAYGHEGLRRDRHRRGTQRAHLGRPAAASEPAHPVPGGQAVRGRNGLHSRVVRRLQVRDRGLAAVPDLEGSERGTRPGRPAHRRHGRHVGDAPVVYHTDPLLLMTHLNEVHGSEVVAGMAGLVAWSQAPARALGRFEAGRPPMTLDEMYACATSEFERSSITDLLFGSVSDVLDRYLPDREKHGALRGMLAFLAVNTTYRGPATPGSAAALAFGLAVPDENTVLMKKLRGGIGALTTHLR